MAMSAPSTEPRLTIGGLAAAAGVNVETVRFYQRKGLLPQPARPTGSIRRYGEADRSRIHFIKSAQRLGFSLDEIGELLQLDDGSSCAAARKKAQAKLTDVRARLSDLQRMETVLADLIKLCGATTGKVSCPLITALQQAQELL